MDFKSFYLKNIDSHHSSVINSIFLKNNPYFHSSPFLSMKAYGTISASFPFSYSCSMIPYFVLLYTTSGEGQVTINESTYSLITETLLFIPELTLHKFEIIHSNWTYDIVFFNGLLASSIFDSFFSKINSYTFFTNGNLLLSLKPLIHSAIDPLSSPYKQSLLLNCLLLNLLDSIEKANNPDLIPLYLQKIKFTLDRNYSSDYSLSILSAQYKISPYKLCREFSTYFHSSPIQYLNNVRLNASIELLTTSALHINEIADKIGFHSTNHFIRLFKRKTGKTPLVYRKCFSLPLSPI